MNIPERLVPGTDVWHQGFADHIQRYRFASRWCKDKVVLDAGCGVGYGTSFIKEHGAERVVGVDIANEALVVASTNYSGEGIQFVQDDCEELPMIVGPFGSIVALEVFEHLENPKAFLKRCVELLCENGTMIVSTPNAAILPKSVDGTPRNPYHVTEYTLTEFRSFLEKYFSCCEIFYQCRTPTLDLRADTKNVLECFKSNLQSNLAIRLANGVRRLIKGSPYPMPDLNLLRYPAESDYQIVRDVTLPDETWVFIAVCTIPKK